MRAFESYARPFRSMWPWFWLKAAALKLDEEWHLTMFLLSGQWDDTKSGAPVELPYETLALVSMRLDADAAWRLVESLVVDRTIAMADGIVATAPDGPASLSAI